MITELQIKNYKSIADATIKLSPFTLLIGANGAGKSNLLDLIEKLGSSSSWVKHLNYNNIKGELTIKNNDLGSLIVTDYQFSRSLIREYANASIFSLTPQKAGISESLTEKPFVQKDGSGTVQVLDSLKTGDREDLFNTIEKKFKTFIPEIEKLSFMPVFQAKKLQVRERNINAVVPVNLLSEGTQLTLILLTILYQENPPSIICIEDIDKGLHPRLYGQIIDLCFELTKQQDKEIQIIATTHNPYLVDHFKDNEEAVVIVEKEKGETTFTTLVESLNDDIEDEPLGELWYSGSIGGVPKK